MKTTVTIAGILNLMGAVLFTLSGLSVIFLPQVQSVYNEMNPPWSGEILGGVLILIGLLPLWTAIGLFMHKDFARLTTRVLGFFLLLYGVALGVVESIRIPSTTTSSLTNTLKAIVILGFAAILIGIGLWWLLCFRRSKMGHLFTTTGVVTCRPTSISVIAILKMGSLLSIPINIMSTYVKIFPLMGVVIKGPSAKMILVLLSIVSTVIGYGLWRMKDWAWKLGVVLSVFTITNLIVCQLIPWVQDQLMQLNSVGASTLALAISQQFRTYAGWWVPIGLNVLICYFLISRRRFFKKTNP